jgi:hypothetical protein
VPRAGPAGAVRDWRPVACHAGADEYEETPMSRPDWAPEGVDLERPNVARMYDYYLGGSHNVGIDREVAEQAIAAFPDLPRVAQANRAFLHRAVRYCLDAGVNQFLDIGSGIPTVGNVHEIAQRADPEARVVYVDTDAVAIAHAHAILTGNDRTTAVLHDVRSPEDLLRHPDVRRVLDLDRPLAVLLVAVLHFIPDSDDPADLVARLVAPTVPGSHLVISHAFVETLREREGPVLTLYRRTRTPLVPRPRAEIVRLFDGLELLEPGVVFAPQWHPDAAYDIEGPQDWSYTLAGVARKP